MIRRKLAFYFAALFAVLLLLPIVALAQAAVALAQAAGAAVADGSTLQAGVDVGGILALVSWFSKLALGLFPPLHNTIVGNILAWFVRGPLGATAAPLSDRGPG